MAARTPKDNGAAGPPTDLAGAFLARFAGLSRARGRYVIQQDAAPGAKLVGQAVTERRGPDLEAWRLHLEGRDGLGVVPIRDDDTCLWGAIDVDVYSLDLPRLEETVKARALPLTVARTKSGGAHLYLFLAEPVPAERGRARLGEWAGALGYAGTEVFPKQVKLANENDVGNWLNMPYHGGEETTRYAIRDGQRLGPAEFLALAAARSLTAEALAAFVLPLGAGVAARFHEGPPCLQTLATGGFPPGSRNQALFNVAVYLKKRYAKGPEDWEQLLMTYNQEFMRPPLPPREVNGIRQSMHKKDYGYRCRDAPINAVCARAACLKREFGVGETAGGVAVEFGELTKVTCDPPLWLWDVDGLRLELRTEDLMSQGAFARACVTRLGKWPGTMKPGAWQILVQSRLDRAATVDPPPEIQRHAEYAQQLAEFLEGCVAVRDELLAGNPHYDAAEGVVRFRLSDFDEQLRRGHLKEDRGDLYLWLTERGATTETVPVKGSRVRVWVFKPTEEERDQISVASEEAPRETARH